MANDLEEGEEDVEGEEEGQGEEIEVEVPIVEADKTQSNHLILNKKGNIDEEIVESVSQLESVITKTIENTKNLEDIPDMVVEQPDEDLLSEVLQPIEDLDSTNSVYDKPNNELNLPQEILASQSSSTPISNLNTVNTGVNVQDNIDSFSDSTTPLSLTSSHHKHKDHHLDLQSPSSSSSSSATNHHKHSHLPSTNNDVTSTTTTTATNSITNTHLTPTDILTDITTLMSTNTPIDSSTPSSIIVSSSSSSSSSSVSSSVLKKVKCVLFYNANPLAKKIKPKYFPLNLKILKKSLKLKR